MIHIGDCLEILPTIAAESVQCCVTSPPYYGLRDYGMAGQHGLEETPEQFIANQVAVFRAVHRVLRNDGTLWINIGDSYNSSAGGYDETGSRGATSMPSLGQGTMAAVVKGLGRRPAEGMKPKDLIGIPWMLAFALRADGWYLRQDIIWHKPNPMPESVTDRCTKAHEYLFLLSKSKRYYFDADAIKEARTSNEDAAEFRGGCYTQGDIQNDSMGVRKVVGNRRVGGWAAGTESHTAIAHNQGERKPKSSGVGFGHGFDANPKPRVSESKRNTFARETKSTPGEHGQKPQHRVNREAVEYSGTRNKRSVWTVATQPFKQAHFATFPEALIQPCILAGSRPGDAVLDPYMGAGTTAVVCERLGRRWIGCELNPAYAAMAKVRIRNTQPGLALESIA